MSIANRNSYGFFVIQNLKYDGLSENGVNGVKEIRRFEASCSQVVKMSANTDFRIKKGIFTFYYPTDWLIRSARNQVFFNDWVRLSSELFFKVKYLGRKSTESLNLKKINPYNQNIEEEINFNTIKNWSRGNSTIELQNKNLLNELGNYIENDSWEVFEINFDDNDNEKQMKVYCCFCMIRYLFSDHYGIIVDNFKRIRNSARIYTPKFTEFDIIQMAHYYFAGNNGFYQTYSLMKVIDRSSYVYNLITLEQFNESIKSETLLHNIFFKNGKSDLSISDFQGLVENGNIKNIYERIKK